jgi:hypothetical protein
VGEISRRQLLAGVAGATFLPAAGVLAGAAPAEAAEVLPSRADVLAVARRVNDQWIGAHGDPGTTSGRGRPTSAETWPSIGPPARRGI